MHTMTRNALIWTFALATIAASAWGLSGCGPAIAGDVPGSELTAAEQPACVEGLGHIQGAVKCDWQSTYAAPRPVLCFDHGNGDMPVGGCTIEERDSPETPVYRTSCVAACPDGTAKMSPEAIAFLKSTGRL